MIHQICNQAHEQLETFYKVAIIKKSSLTFFTHLSSDTTIQDIITNIPDSADAFVAQLLPEDLSLTSGSRSSDAGKRYTVRSRFNLTPLDKNLQDLLEEYNNQEVIMLLDKHNATFIYGTPQTPLLFLYSENHSNQNQGLKGYEINITGDQLGAVKQFEEITLNIFSRGLAFELAQEL